MMFDQHLPRKPILNGPAIYGYIHRSGVLTTLMCATPSCWTRIRMAFSVLISFLVLIVSILLLAQRMGLRSFQSTSLVVEYIHDLSASCLMVNTIATRSAFFFNQIWDLKIQRRREYLQGHTDHVCVVYYHPDHMKLITGSLDGTIRIWDATTYRYPFDIHIWALGSNKN